MPKKGGGARAIPAAMLLQYSYRNGHTLVVHFTLVLFFLCMVPFIMHHVSVLEVAIDHTEVHTPW